MAKVKDKNKAPKPETAKLSASTETLSPDTSVLSDARARYYKRHIDATISHYDQKLAANFKRLRQAYETGADTNLASGSSLEHKIRVPVLLPATQAKIAAIYPKNPDIRVKPKRKTFKIKQQGGLPDVEIDGEDAADRVKALIDYDAVNLDLSEEILMALTDADIIGYGAVECGWDAFAKLEENKTAAADGTAKDTGEDLAKSTLEFEEEGKEHDQEVDLRYDPMIQEEQPWAEWIPSEDLKFPKHQKNILKTPWMFTTKRTAAEEIKADRRLTLPEDFDEHASYVTDTDTKTTSPRQKGPDDTGYVDRIDFWSKLDRIHAVYVRGIASPVMVEAWPYAAKGYPIKIVMFYHNPRGGLPISPTGLCLPQQNEKNLIRTRMAGHIAKWQSKVLVDSTVSEDEVQRFKTAPDGGLVTVEDIRKYLLVNPAPMPPEWNIYDRTTDQDIYSISGVNEYQRGGTGGAKFATEAVLMQQNAATKVERQKDKAKKYFVEIASYLFQLRQQFMTKTIDFAITGEAGFEYKNIDPRYIQGDFDFEINMESSAATDAQRDAEVGKMLLTIGMEAAANPNVPLVPDAVFDRALKLLRIPSRHELIKVGENFEAMRAAEYEDTLMMTGQPVQPDPKEDLSAHIATHTQMLAGMKQVIANGEIKDPHKAQMAMQGLQLIQQHVAMTAALMDKTGQLQTSIAAGQPGTPQAGGRVRTDVQQQGAGQGAQPDRLNQGKQQQNAQRAGTGTSFMSKVTNQTGGT